ncbi:MAG: hypothetical protein MZV64_29035 [Ignavibacteriales bacterium]|nr:hypothetical protein [Ignavibacteriales bacterium]
MPFALIDERSGQVRLDLIRGGSDLRDGAGRNADKDLQGPDVGQAGGYRSSGRRVHGHGRELAGGDGPGVGRQDEPTRHAEGSDKGQGDGFPLFHSNLPDQECRYEPLDLFIIDKTEQGSNGGHDTYSRFSVHVPDRSTTSSANRRSAESRRLARQGSRRS